MKASIVKETKKEAVTTFNDMDERDLAVVLDGEQYGGHIVLRSDNVIVDLTDYENWDKIDNSEDFPNVKVRILQKGERVLLEVE